MRPFGQGISYKVTQLSPHCWLQQDIGVVISKVAEQGGLQGLAFTQTTLPEKQRWDIAELTYHRDTNLSDRDHARPSRLL